MAVARKCDRCGKFFMPDISNGGHKQTFVRLNTYYTTGAAAGDNIHTVDLCNECNQSIEEWMMQEQKNKDIRKETIEEFSAKIYEHMDKHHGKICLMDFDNLYMQMKGERNENKNC